MKGCTQGPENERRHFDRSTSLWGEGDFGSSSRVGMLLPTLDKVYFLCENGQSIVGPKSKRRWTSQRESPLPSTALRPTW